MNFHCYCEWNVDILTDILNLSILDDSSLVLKRSTTVFVNVVMKVHIDDPIHFYVDLYLVLFLVLSENQLNFMLI